MQITKTNASLLFTFFGSKIHLMTKCDKNPFYSRPYLISCQTKARMYTSLKLEKMSLNLKFNYACLAFDHD